MYRGMKKRLIKVSMSSLTCVLRATKLCLSGSICDIQHESGVRYTTTCHSLLLLSAVKLVLKDDEGRWHCDVAEVGEDLTEETTRSLVRTALERHRPFVLIREGLEKGQSYEDARRRVAGLLKISDAGLNDLDVLVRVAVEVGLLHVVAPRGFEMASSKSCSVVVRIVNVYRKDEKPVLTQQMLDRALSFMPFAVCLFQSC